MMIMRLINREQYLNKLIALKDKQIIKVVAGVRRCGKSTLLALFQQYLVKHGVGKKNIVYLNFEDYSNLELRDSKKLYEFLSKKISSQKKMVYIFLDEVQQVENFAQVIDSLFIKENVDLYVTGSNAYLLSGEIATLIAGRYIEIPMLPFSFREYVMSITNTTDSSSKLNANLQSNLQEKYSDYTEFGSFPFVMSLNKNESLIHDYLDGIYHTIVLKDIIARHKISDAMMLESVIRFMFDNIGNTLSTKKIADTMTSVGRKIEVKTVEKFLTALVECFVLYKANRYDIKGKQYLKTLEKYYVVDTGLRNYLLGSRALDVGHVLENNVYLELIHRGEKVFIGKKDNLEIDFVCVSSKGLSYYQVAATVREKKTLERELAPLKSIKDQYPKYLLTLDEDPDGDFDGIKRMNALKWMMKKQ